MEGGEGEGGEGVPECPNPELASLHKNATQVMLALAHYLMGIVLSCKLQS